MTDQLKSPSSNGSGADIDATETSEWLEAVDAVVAHDGPDRARQLLTRVVERAQHAGTGPIATLNTPYLNTIPLEREAKLPGDPAVERRLRSIIRWNAMAMVVRANKESSELGGHIATYQSLATLQEVGYNHFWRAPGDDDGGDLIYFQGHSSPGNYARAYLEGRLTEEQLDGFRQEVSKPDGLSLLSAPLADARLLAVSDRLAGDRRDHLDLPGAFHAVSRGPWNRRHSGPQGVGVHRRRRGRRTRDDGLDRAGRPRAARQPDLGRQRQPPAARRARARQRQDHPRARVGLPRRGLERDQGDLGLALGPPARGGRGRPAAARDGGIGGRRVPDLQVARRRLRSRALLRQGPGAARPCSAHVRRRDLAFEPRRARPAEGLRRLPRGRSPPRPADRDPRQDDQGLRDGRLGRRSDDHPPGQEDDRGRTAGVPRSLRAAAHRRAGT